MLSSTHPLRVPLLTALAMLAFAGNSMLCRVALRDTTIDAASFTARDMTLEVTGTCRECKTA